MSGSEEWQALRRKGAEEVRPVAAPADWLRSIFSQTGMGSPGGGGGWGSWAEERRTEHQGVGSWTQRGKSELHRGPL